MAIAATPAAADPARPTDYRSEVLATDPILPPGFRATVVGGDAFFELEVPQGHTAEVPDLAVDADGDPLPYLRFAADGTVERNAASVSALANESRYGVADTAFDPDATPRWEVVATDGAYAWHDHRIHWMSPRAPTAVDGRGRVDLGGPDGTWSVDLVIDGRPTVVRGQLLLLDPPSPAPWLGLLALVVGGGLALGLAARRAGRPLAYRPIAVGTALVATTAVGIGWATWQAIPSAAGGNALPVVVPAVAVTGAVLGALGPLRLRLTALGAAAACLLGWGALRWTVLTRAELPTTAPFAVDRAATALALGAGAALALLLVWQPPRRTAAAPPPGRASPGR